MPGPFAALLANLGPFGQLMAQVPFVKKLNQLGGLVGDLTKSTAPGGFQGPTRQGPTRSGDPIGANRKPGEQVPTTGKKDASFLDKLIALRGQRSRTPLARPSPRQFSPTRLTRGVRRRAGR